MAGKEIDRELKSLIEFLRDAGRLKDTMRSAVTAKGNPESVAAHTWRLSLLAIVLADYLEDIDHHRLLKLLVIHDLGEAISGDVPATEQVDPQIKAEKEVKEREDFLVLIGSLPSTERGKMLELWEEYDVGQTPEARIAKGLDKIETMLQHNEIQNASDFDFTFNLDYGRQHTDWHPILQALRGLVDQETRDHIADQLKTRNG